MVGRVREMTFLSPRDFREGMSTKGVTLVFSFSFVCFK